jgi:hypothetical protein
LISDIVLDSQMAVFSYEISLAPAMANYNKALAKSDLLAGKPPTEPSHVRGLR